MKEIDYKQLKKYSNLPKFDIGTRPIGSGYLRNADQTQTGYFTQTAEPVTNAFIPQAISSGVQNVANPLLSLGKNAANYISAYNNTIQEIGAKYGKLAALQVGDEARNAVYNEGLNVAKSSAKSAASKALGAANIALNAYGAIHGGIDLLNNWKDSSTLSSGDLSNMASRSTEYVNGIAYDRMGGYDSSGVDKYVRDQNKASKIGGITSGLETGAGIGGLIGSIFPGAGTLIGSGIGAVVGALGGLFGGESARKKRERAIAEAKRNYANAADAYNLQNESEAASTGIRNMYYATHADKGLDAGEEPNALVNNKEVLGTVKNGKVKQAFTVDSNLPDRYDGIPANLGPNDFVIGHKIGPDGVELNEKAQIYERMFNSRDPRLQKIGEEGLLLTLKTLKRTPDNNPNPWDLFTADRGKNMKRYDKGSFSGAWIPTIAFGANELDNWAHKKEIDRMPITAFNAYTPNPYILLAGALMPSTYDINPQRQTINNEARFANYAINQSAYSPGLKMAMLNNMWSKRMKAMSDLMGEKQQLENTMRANYAKWLSEVGAQEQQMKSAYMQKYYDQLAQANARKFNAQQTLRKDRRQNWDDFLQNFWNIYQGNKTAGLFKQDLTNKQLKTIENLAQNYWNPMSMFQPYKMKSPLEKGT